MIYTRKILTAGYLKLQRGSDGNTFKKRLSYQIKIGNLLKIRRGLYVLKDQLYSLDEDDYKVIANSIYTPSYISYETVLRQHALIFQHYESIYIASKYTKSLQIEIDTTIQPVWIESYRMPTELLANPIGIETKHGYAVASIERAVCDIVRRSPRYYFDTLSATSIRLDALYNIASLYEKYKPGFINNLTAILQKHDITLALGA